MTAPLPTLLAWDSEFFGVRIGRMPAAPLSPADVTAGVRWADASRVQCLYALADAADLPTVAALDTGGFARVDCRLTLTRPLTSEPAQSSGVRLATDRDVDALAALARVSHRNTRFYRDGHFDHTDCDALYATWITRAVGAPRGCVLVGGDAAVIRGYLAVEAAPEPRIGLVAVDPLVQRMGVGRALVDAACAWLVARDARSISVVTQGDNPAAVAFYERCGFREARREIWFHRWSS